MSPVDFGTGVAAHVDLGEGAHFPQLRVTADDESCVWNDFPVQIGYKLFPFVSGNAVPMTGVSSQIQQFTTPDFFAGTYVPSEAEWPFFWFGNIHRATLSGLDVVSFRIQLITCGGGTSVGSIGHQTQAGLFCGSRPGPIAGVYDSGTVSVAGQGCFNCASADPSGIKPAFTNFSPITSGVCISHGKETWSWGADPLAVADWEPDQEFYAWFNPPCTPEGGTLPICPSISATSPPTADWENSIIVGDSGMEARSTTFCQVGSTSSGRGTMWWDADTFGAAQWVEAFATTHPVSPDAIWLFTNLTNPGTANVCGYALEGTTTTAKVYRIDNGVFTLLDTFALSAPMAQAMGYKLAMSQAGLIVRANIEVPTYGIEMPFVGTVSDTTYFNQGQVGVGIDDLVGRIVYVGGGNLGSSLPTGLFVSLETNSCGVLTKTYANVRDAINALNCGLTASVLGGHGSDIAGISAGSLQGALCAGALDHPYTG